MGDENMAVTPLPDFVVVVIAIVVPSIAILTIVVNVLKLHRYRKDVLEIVKGISAALSGLDEKGVLGLLRFDLLMDKLNDLVPNLSSSTGQTLALFICDAKGVALNELNRNKVSDPQLLKDSLSRELVSLISVAETYNTTQAFEQVGNVYIVTMLRGKNVSVRLGRDLLVDQNVSEMLIDFSNAMFQGDDRALSEELGVFLETRSENDWQQMSPFAALALYWLRRELLSISSEEWLLEERKHIIWATQEELLSLSLANIAIAIAEGDYEAVVETIASYYQRRNYPAFVARLQQKHYVKRDRTQAAI
jgi:hypothetical protein